MSNWVAGLTASQIPEAELVLARARIADTAGLLVAGCTTPASGAAIDLAREIVTRLAEIGELALRGVERVQLRHRVGEPADFVRGAGRDD